MLSGRDLEQDVVVSDSVDYCESFAELLLASGEVTTSGVF